jgi:hypothetical protein
MLFKICCKAPYQEDLQGKVKSAPFVLCAKKRLKTRLISYCNVQANNIFFCKKYFVGPRDKNPAPFKLNGQSRTAFGLLKAPELQRLCKAPYQEDLQGKVKSAPFVLCAKKRLKTEKTAMCKPTGSKKTIHG